MADQHRYIFPEHRGWVFQERLLSKRVLYFTSIQLFWQCICRNLHSSSSIVIDTCLSGLWQNDLGRGLLWTIHDSSQSANSSIPSWSWASLKSEVHFPKGPFHTPWQRYYALKVTDPHFLSYGGYDSDETGAVTV